MIPKEPAHSLILASDSPCRRRLLRTISQSFLVLVPHVDESPLPGESPAACALRLAAAKAGSVAGGQTPILAADTVAALCGHILDKPRNEPAAAAVLGRISGQWVDFYTGVAVLHAGRMDSALSHGRVRFQKISAARIHSYLDSGEWRGKAGGLAIQGRAGELTMQIEADYGAIVGLPLQATAKLLATAGVSL